MLYSNVHTANRTAPYSYTFIQGLCVCAPSLSHVRLFVTPWTMAGQAPLSMELFRQEYWSGLPFSSPVDLSDPGIKPAPPALAGGFLTTAPPGKPVKAKASIFLIPLLLLQRHTHTHPILYLENTFHTLHFVFHFKM